MLSILAGFIYSGFIMLVLGTGFNKFIKYKFEYELPGFDNLIMAGLIISTIYAQIFSIIYRVSLLANIILIVICIVIGFICQNELKQKWVELVSMPRIKKAFVILMSLLVAYFTSRGFFHYDTELYHAQSIRWIEEYGVVKGLGNLHNRIGYNSSLFSLTALFSLKFLFGQSLHFINGLIALILANNIWPMFEHCIKKKIEISDFLRLGIIYYLVSICGDINSPASDYAVLMLAFFIILKWEILLEEKEKSVTPFACLCMAAVFGVTLKLSICVILVLLIKPVIELIKKKEYKTILFFIVMGIIIVAPWCIRTVLITGYLIYPFPAIDLFNVDWKIPLIDAINDANEIKEWGKNGFATLEGMEKLLVIGDYISLIILGVIFIIKSVTKKLDKDKVLICIAIIVCFGFWHETAPLIRYGYSYVLLLLFITAGICYEEIVKIGQRRLYIVATAMIVFFTAWKSVSLVKNIYQYVKWPAYIMQTDYNNAFEAKSYDIDGITIYYPASGDRMGYHYFPASTDVRDITLRGEDIKDGFKVK